MTVSRETRLGTIALHTDPHWGSVYWRERFAARGLGAADVADNPALIGVMDQAALRQRPVEDFIPRRVLESGARLITSETSGMTGRPIVTVFSEREFQDAFVEPFLHRARAVGFPLRARWLWIGPSGPHAIGKAVREILRAVDGFDPFSIDFDPRWFRKMPAESTGRARYLAHLEAQIMDVLDRQRVEVLFATPPILRRLAARLPAERRAAFTGVHYGGMSLSAAEYDELRAAFPNAVHLHGYGNSLFGVFIESGRGPDGIRYAAHSARVSLDVVQPAADGADWSVCAPGETGRVLLSRYDESFMILNQLERDVATRTDDGILDPHPPDPATNRATLY